MVGTDRKKVRRKILSPCKEPEPYSDMGKFEEDLVGGGDFVLEISYFALVSDLEFRI
jgi:hypothetical protein